MGERRQGALLGPIISVGDRMWSCVKIAAAAMALWAACSEIINTPIQHPMRAKFMVRGVRILNVSLASRPIGWNSKNFIGAVSQKPELVNPVFNPSVNPTCLHKVTRQTHNGAQNRCPAR